jgi:hypothetical protein
MQPYHGAQQLPSPREIARALDGHVRKDGAIAFPGPGKGPHVAALTCLSCGRHGGWLSHDQARALLTRAAP